MLTRTHHAIADGIRMVQIAMSLFDATAGGGALLSPSDPTTDRAEPAEDGRSFLDRLGDDLRAIGAELGKPVREIGRRAVSVRTARRPNIRVRARR